MHIQPLYQQFLNSCKPGKMRDTVIYVHHVVLYNMALTSVMVLILTDTTGLALFRFSQVLG